MLKLITIDNFLKKDDFKRLNKIKLNKVDEYSVKVYQNTFYSKKNIVNTCISKGFLKKIHDRYHGELIKILNKIDYEKSKLYEFSEISVVKTGKNAKFPIHDDTPDKLLSGVIYLYPKKNTGTIFYLNKKKIVSWKENRAVFFSRKERETWHSYEGNKISDRVVLVYNLKTSNLRKVYDIEKKNFYLGYFRFKINPYLYRYFKFTI